VLSLACMTLLLRRGKARSGRTDAESRPEHTSTRKDVAHS